MRKSPASLINVMPGRQNNYLSGTAPRHPHDSMQGGRHLEEAALADVCQRTAQECSQRPVGDKQRFEIPFR